MKSTNNLTPKENDYLEGIFSRIELLQTFLDKNNKPDSSNLELLYAFLSKIKNIQGNFNNDISFIATLMAKYYLLDKYAVQDYDAAKKAQGAPGLDIDIFLPNGDQLVAEIKTTYPYKQNDLGANQKEKFNEDFEKLKRSTAKHKLFFLTERTTFELLRKPKYFSSPIGIQIVLLPSGEEFSA